MNKQLLSLLAVAMLMACNKEAVQVSVPVSDNIFSISAAPYENESDCNETKSAYFDEEAQKVTNLNIWVYNNSTGELVNNADGYQTYFVSKTDIDGDLLFPDMDTQYDIYMFTNVGQVTPPANKTAAESYNYTFSSYDSFSTAGFPMAAHYCFTPSDPSQSHTLKVKRLVSKYIITFNFNSENDYEFNLESAKVCQSSKVINPFVTESKASSATEVFEEADELSTTELLSNGGELYMLENIQGDIFQSGAIRTRDNIYPNSKKDCTTYLEFSGQLDKNDGTGYEKVTCRYYFGANADGTGTYAGVKRNYNVNLTLTMTNSILNHDEWTVTPEDPYNTGYVVFNPTSLLVVGDGNWNNFTTATYSAEGVNNNVQYTLTYNSSDWSTAALSLQYRKASSDSWADFSGQELSGPYNFQVKSTYSGAEQKTVCLDIECLGVASSIGSGRLVMTIKKKTYPIYSCGTMQLRPNTNYNPDYPGGDYLQALNGNNEVLIWRECHEYDLQFGTSPCHSIAALELGYLDDNNIFHEFTDYTIYKESTLDTIIDFDSIANSVLSSALYSDTYFNWSESSSVNTSTVFISVNDSGYEGVYKGKCYKYNNL